ncbi:hypothetical protein [Pseudovibrio sp. POLY-S9]|uniref:hypothetical protein n=1 Tax=Pseudovibrio sp. POLY-S9 TaxID=1576596 RepID=UPI00070DE2C2|nr:hypothetical protein [Pseudovibrio sp. POLY-S9]
MRWAEDPPPLPLLVWASLPGEVLNSWRQDTKEYNAALREIQKEATDSLQTSTEEIKRRD